MKNLVAIILLIILSTSTLFTSDHISLSTLLQNEIATSGDPFNLNRHDRIFYKIQSHIDFNKKVLSKEEIIELHYILWKILWLQEKKSDSLNLLSKYQEIIESTPEFENEMYKLHEAQFGKIKNKENDDLPAFATNSECFFAAKLPYSAKFDNEVQSNELYAAKPLYDVYFACIEKVKNNQNKIIKKYEQQQSAV